MEVPSRAGDEEESIDLADHIIQTIREALVVLDKNLRVRLANRAFYRTFRVTPGETEGRPFFELGNGQWDIPKLRHLLGEILPRDNPFDDFEVTHDFEAIGRKTMVLNARRVDKDGEPQFILLAIEDVTDRREARSRLRQGEARHRLVIESLTDYAVITLTTAGVIDGWNAGAKRMFGYAEEEAIGRDGRMFFTPEDVAAEVPEAEMRQALAEGRASDDRWHVRKDGSRFWATGLAMPLRDEGRVLGFVKVMRDMTEQRLAEEASRDAERRKDEFLAMLAHELRNPLSAIANAVQLAARLGTASQREWADEVVRRNVATLSRLIDDLLDVSRIASGKIRLRLEPLDLADVLRQTADHVGPQVEQKGHTLEVALPAEPLPMKGDATRLEQIFVNLLGNALKYTSDGGSIRLAAARHDGSIEVRVRDDGPGIAPDLLPHVFDLFTQAERTIDRAQGGLGIGLTVVRMLCEMHGGSVVATSEGLGKGSEFVVRLPLATDAAVAAQARDSRAKGPRGKLKVLVIDDNDDNARTLSRLLVASGHEAETARDGPSGIEAAERFGPDAILLDIGLPRMDGYQVAERLRRSPRFSQTLIVAISGYGEERAVNRSSAAGIDHHLVKPVDFTVLAELLASWRGRRPAGA